MADIDKVIAKKVGKAIYEYNMIEEGDKILIAVSGGKDSVTLLHDFCRRRRSFPIKFEIVAAHIMTDFCTCCKKGSIEKLFKDLDVEYEMLDVPVLQRLKPGKKMNCYWCSTQRRMELMNIAERRGCNKIALGHHLDDIIETFFMNICYKSELATMLPMFKYEKFPYEVIRPLALVKEHEIIKYATKTGINKLVCTCPYGKNSKRLEIRSMIKELAKTNKNIRENIYKSMKNYNKEYMLG